MEIITFYSTDGTKLVLIKPITYSMHHSIYNKLRFGRISNCFVNHLIVNGHLKKLATLGCRILQSIDIIIKIIIDSIPTLISYISAGFIEV